MDDIKAELEILREKIRLNEENDEKMIQEMKDMKVMMLDFIQKAITIFWAYCVSQCGYHWLEAAGMSPRSIRSVQVVAMSFLTPTILWGLHGDIKEGSGYHRNFLKILNASAPMLLAWAWKDWTATFFDEIGDDVGQATTSRMELKGSSHKHHHHHHHHHLTS